MLEEVKVISLQQKTLPQLFEAYLFIADKPTSVGKLSDLGKCKKEETLEALDCLKNKYSFPEYSYHIFEHADGLMLALKPEYKHWLNAALDLGAKQSKKYLEEYLYVQNLRGRSKTTLKTYGQFLNRFLDIAACGVDDITTRDIRKFLMEEFLIYEGCKEVWLLQRNS